MANSKDPVHIYIDGNSFYDSVTNGLGRPSVDANLALLFDDIASKSLDGPRGTTNYYTSVTPVAWGPTDLGAYMRAQEIAHLDRLNEQGITTFANDAEILPTGELQETGIETKMAADIAADFISNRTISRVMVVSNDINFTPTANLLRTLAKTLHRPIEVIHLAVKSSHETTIVPRMDEQTTKVQLEAKQYEGFAPVRTASGEYRLGNIPFEYEDILAARAVRVDKARALDISRHSGPDHQHSLTRARGTPTHRSGYYFDVDSLNRTAQAPVQNGGFDRPHLDVNLFGFMKGVINQFRENTTVAVNTYFSLLPKTDTHNQPIPKADIHNQIMIDMAASLRHPIGAFTYYSRLPSHDRPPTPSQQSQKMLADVVLDVISGVDNITLISDNKTLSPIAETAKFVGRTIHDRGITVSNLHFDKQAIPYTQGTRLEAAAYTKHIEPENFLGETHATVKHLPQQQQSPQRKSRTTPETSSERGV